MIEIQENFSNWETLRNGLLSPLLVLLIQKMEERPSGNENTNFVCRAATQHFAQCYEVSDAENRKGHHAISMCILRQCIESLSIIELGFSPDIEWADSLLSRWHENKISLGKIRQALEEHLWKNYGNGLWSETWAEFFAELAGAVQPYAHYTRDLQAWQMEILKSPEASKNGDGNIILYAKIGPNTYHINKATRIIIYQTVLMWALGRILTFSSRDSRIEKDKLFELGAFLSTAPELGMGKWSWKEQFWATEFDEPM